MFPKNDFFHIEIDNFCNFRKIIQITPLRITELIQLSNNYEYLKHIGPINFKGENMIIRSSATKCVNVSEKILRRVVASGKKCQIVEFVLKKGAVIPPHKHIHEQIGFVQKGKIRITIGGVSNILNQGDAYQIEPDLEHEVEVLEDSIAIDVFSPPREDFMA